MACHAFAGDPSHCEKNVVSVKTAFCLHDSDDEYLPKYIEPFPAKKQRHGKRTGRRQSANADILESLGLPTTGSYHDMKTLQGGLSVDDILGRRSTCGDCLRKAASAVCGNAATAAKRVSTSAVGLARRSKRLASRSSSKHRKTSHHKIRYLLSEENYEPDRSSRETILLPVTTGQYLFILRFAAHWAKANTFMIKYYHPNTSLRLAATGFLCRRDIGCGSEESFRATQFRGGDFEQEGRQRHAASKGSSCGENSGCKRCGWESRSTSLCIPSNSVEAEEDYCFLTSLTENLKGRRH